MVVNKRLVVFFVFVIFGNALGDHHEKSHSHHVKSHHHGKHHHSHFARADQDNCRWVCDNGTIIDSPSTTEASGNVPSGTTQSSGDTGSSSSTTSSPGSSSEGCIKVTLVTNADATIIGVLNVTAKVATIVDLNSKIDLELNAQTGTSYAISLGERVTVRVVSNLKITGSIQDYIKNLKSLDDIIKGGSEISLDDLTEDQINDINRIRLQLGVLAGTPLQNKILETKNAIQLLNGPLKGLYKSNLNIEIRQSLETLSNVQIALNATLGGKNVSQIKGGLNVQKILNQDNGLATLLEIIIELAAQNSLSLIDSELLMNPVKLFRVLVLLSSPDDNGVDILIGIYYQIILLINQQGNLDNLIEAIIRLATPANLNLANSVQEFIRLSGEIAKAVQSLGRTVFSSISGGNWQIGGVNLSQIIISIGRADASNIISIITTITSNLGNLASSQQTFQSIIVVIGRAARGDYARQIIAKLGINIPGNPAEAIQSFLKDLQSGNAGNQIISQLSQLFKIANPQQFLSGALNTIQQGFETWGDIIGFGTTVAKDVVENTSPISTINPNLGNIDISEGQTIPPYLHNGGSIAVVTGNGSSGGSTNGSGNTGGSGGQSSGGITVGGTGNISGETGGISINGSGNISGSTGGISISHTGGSNSGSVNTSGGIAGGLGGLGGGSGSGSGNGSNGGSIGGIIGGSIGGGGSGGSGGSGGGSGGLGGSGGGSGGAGGSGGTSGGSGGTGGGSGGSGGAGGGLGGSGGAGGSGGGSWSGSASGSANGSGGGLFGGLFGGSASGSASSSFTHKGGFGIPGISLGSDRHHNEHEKTHQHQSHNKHQHHDKHHKEHEKAAHHQ